MPGGAATVLDLPLDETKELKSLTMRAIANEVVIGLMGGQPASFSLTRFDSGNRNKVLVLAL